MKRFIFGSLMAGLVVVGLSVNAEDTAPGAVPAVVPAVPVEKSVKKERAPMPVVDVTVSGTLTKKEITKTDKKTNKEVKRVHYSLVQEDGVTIMLPGPRSQKGQAPAVNLDAFVDKKVKIVGKGREVMDKMGGKKSLVSEITTIEEVAAAPVVAPVAAPDAK